MSHGMNEDAWEQLTLEVLAEPLGWRPEYGAQIAPGSGGEGAVPKTVH